jgi:hypothetical protein
VFSFDFLEIPLQEFCFIRTNEKFGKQFQDCDSDFFTTLFTLKYVMVCIVLTLTPLLSLRGEDWVHQACFNPTTLLVSVPRRADGHIYLCKGYRFASVLYDFLVEFWNCYNDVVLLSCISLLFRY